MGVSARGSDGGAEQLCECHRAAHSRGGGGARLGRREPRPRSIGGRRGAATEEAGGGGRSASAKSMRRDPVVGAVAQS
jgi:hypothetical protein